MTLVVMIGAHGALVVLAPRVAVLSLHEGEHLLDAHCSGVLLRRVDLRCHAAPLLIALAVLVGVPLGDVLREDVHHVAGLASCVSRRHEACFP